MCVGVAFHWFLYIICILFYAHWGFFFTFTAAGSAMGSDDIIAGNVSKYIVLPAGYCGQPKKGHLIFDACFESGECF